MLEEADLWEPKIEREENPCTQQDNWEIGGTA